jgi:hypothetical protein
VRSSGGRVTVKGGPAPAPDLVLTGPPDPIVDLFAGRISIDEAKARGLAVTWRPPTTAQAATAGAGHRAPLKRPPLPGATRIRSLRIQRRS